MVIDLPTAGVLARECAPSVAPATMLAVITAESGRNPYAIGDNSSRRQYRPRTWRAADQLATALIATGHNVDLGLAQINSRTAPRVGISVADAFDPCRNLAAAARLLKANYLRAWHATPEQQPALATTLSAYNTGSGSRGFANGYVARVYAAAAMLKAGSRGATRPFHNPGVMASLTAGLPLLSSTASRDPQTRRDAGGVAWLGLPPDPDASPANIMVFDEEPKRGHR